jgi:hypothetical protein
MRLCPKLKDNSLWLSCSEELEYDELRFCGYYIIKKLPLKAESRTGLNVNSNKI